MAQYQCVNDYSNLSFGEDLGEANETPGQNSYIELTLNGENTLLIGASGTFLKNIPGAIFVQ
jgi:hypothetical protein